jgi:hypothetical protein
MVHCRGLETGGVMPQPGPCGDPWQTITDPALRSYVFNLPWGEAARLKTPSNPNANIVTFTAGQRVTFQWFTQAKHTGYYRIKLCPRRCVHSTVLLQALGCITGCSLTKC